MIRIATKLALPTVVCIVAIMSATSASFADDLPKWIDPTDKLVSRHVLWAKPSFDGPLRVLFITHRKGLREVVEICQRFEIARDVAAVEHGNVFHSSLTGTVGRAWKLTDQKSTEDIFRRKLAKDYDCIVVANIRWDSLPDWVRKEILTKVGNGTGLVCRLHDQEDNSLAAAIEKPVSPLPTFSASPFTTISGFKGSKDFSELAERYLRFATIGKGRVVRLVNLPSPYDSYLADSLQILTPECQSPFPYFFTTHYEYHLAFVGQLLRWASDRTPGCRVTSDVPTTSLRVDEPKPISFSLVSDKAASFHLDFSLRDAESGDIVFSASKDVSLSPGRQTVSFEIEEPAGGSFFADLWVKREGKTVDYGSQFVLALGPISISDLVLEKDAFETTETIKGRVSITEPGAELKVHIGQWDNHGRLVAEQVIPASAAKELRFELQPASPLTVLQTIEARLIRNGRTLDMQRRRFTYRDLFPPKDDVLSVIWQNFTGNSFLNPLLAQVYRANGFDAWTTQSPGADGMLLFGGGALQSNLYNAPTIYGRGTTERNPIITELSLQNQSRTTQFGLARVPCLTDPVFLKAAKITYSEFGEFFEPISPAYLNLGDECMFAPHGSNEDLCFSETCVRDFQDFVRSEYGSIEAVNAEYGASYKSFTEVVPVPLDKAMADPRLVPLWIDHRRHADVVWARHVGRVREWVTGAAPGVRVGYEGSGDTGHGPTNGALTATDYYRLAHAMDVNGTYYWPFQLDSVRDFSAPGTLIGGGWFGGYPQMLRANHDPVAQVWWTWNTLFRGANSIWVYAGTDNACWSVVAPDFSFHDYFQATLKQIAILKEGAGKLLMSHTRAHDGVAVLYSPSSMLLASLTDGMPDFWDSVASMPLVLQEALLQYRIVASEQVEAGELRKGGYRLLYLPFCQALSAQEVKAVLDFAQQGGVVLADIRPAVADEHGRSLTAGALDALFGVNQNTAQAAPVIGAVDILDKRLAAVDGPMPALRLDGSLAVAGGHAMAKMDNVPAVVVNDFGRGKGILLNMSLVDYIASAKDSNARFSDQAIAEKTTRLLRAVLNLAGIHPEIDVEPYVPGFHLHRFHADQATLAGLLWDAPAFQPGAPRLEPFHPESGARDSQQLAQMAGERRTVRLLLDDKKHLYDVLGGEYLGFADGVQRTIQPGMPQLLAALPYKTEGLRIRLQSNTVKVGDILDCEMTIIAAGNARAGRHVLRLQFTDPTGDIARHYTVKATAANGKALVSVPLALNEKIGRWRLQVRDVMTGLTGETAFEVGAR